MKTRIVSFCLALCLGLPMAVGLSGCAGDRYERSTGQYIDDQALAMRVRDALGDNPQYKFDGVNVTAFRGTVQLSGFVATNDQKSKAGEIAKTVQGVQNVENNITVKES